MCNNQEATKTSDKLLMQLHEQYAINNNSSMGTIVSLLVSMFAAISGYGYVWTHCGTASKNFELVDLTFAAVGASFILLVMSYICMNQGTSQRLEQFITYKIRDRCKITTFFPKGYDPYFKKGLDVVQGLYGEFVKIFLFVLLFVVASYLFRLYELQGMHWDFFYLIMVYVGLFVYLVLVLLFLFQNVRRYQKRCRLCPRTQNENGVEKVSAEDNAPFNCCIMNAIYGSYDEICGLWEKCKCVQE